MIRRKKTIFTLLLIVIILCITFVSLKFGVFSAKAAGVTDITDTLEKMGENKPINILITESIRKVEVQRAIKLLEEKRTILEAERLQKENERLEEERLALENDPNTKFAYLTFDDGPSATVTLAILDILDEYNIKATFFVVGTMVEKYPEILKEVYNRGHTIGNHSYSHNYKYLYRSSKNFMADIDRADRLLKNVLGEDFETNLLRFPGGSFGKHKAPMIKTAEKAGYTIYDWNSLNGDAEGLNLTNNYLIRRLKETTKNKKNAIILMHDLDSKVGTLETLRENIDYLISQGFHFRVLEENND